MRKLIFITAMLFAVIVPACADQTIKGIVTDGSGKPISGAQVILMRGSRNETGLPIARSGSTSDGTFQITYREPALSSIQTSMCLVGTQGDLIGIESVRNPKATQRIVCRPRASVSGKVTSGGNPVEGASVKPMYFIRDGFFGQHQIDFSRVESVAAIRPAVTDKQGEFTLKGLPSDGDVCFEVTKISDKSKTSAQSTIPVGADNASVVLDEKSAKSTSGRIIGKITDPSTGKPVTGVKVLAVNAEEAGKSDPLSMTTRDDGSFEFNSLTPGTYAVWVMEATRPIEPQMEVPVGEDETVHVGLRAVQGTLVQGRVVDSGTGKCISGVVVSAPGSKPVVTGKDGVFTVNMLPGPGLLGVTDKEGRYIELGHELNVPDKGSVKGLTLKLSPATSIHGQIRDFSGKPADGALLRVLYPNSPGDIVQTDAKGNYRINLRIGGIENLSGFHIAALDPTAGEGTLKDFVPVKGKSTQIDLAIQPCVSVSGTVKGPDGKPIPNAAVLPMLATERYRLHSLHNRTSADESGKFTVHGLIPGASYALRINAEGYEPLVVSKDELSADIILQPKSPSQ